MIQILRKMRKGLLAKNKFLQYIIYASGEIILVIAGILIALAINNKSELNKKDDQIASIMKQIRQDLLRDILRSAGRIDYYHRKDSLINLVLYDQITKQDYQNPENSSLFSLSTNVIEFSINDKGYQSLIRNIDNLPSRYEPLMNGLSQIFINDKNLIDRFNKSISDISDNILKDWGSNFEWYSDLMNGTVNPEVIEYFATDPFYKNHVTTYSIIAIQNHLPLIETYRVRAINSYIAISKLIALEPDPSAIESFMIPVEKLEKLVGTYGPKDDFNVVVTLDNQNQLVAQAADQEPLELYSLSSTRFSSIGIPFLLEFKLDETELGKEIIIHQGSGAVPLSRN